MKVKSIFFNSMAFKLLVSFMDANDIKAIEITKFRDNIVLGDFYSSRMICIRQLKVIFLL